MKILAALLLLSSVASARVVMYSAKNGDTPESIAGDFYGNRSQAVFLIESNGLERDKPLKPGQRVRIPTAFKYRVKKGDTLEALAQKFLDDKRRAKFLAAYSGLKETDKLREGQELLVPFQHVHRAELPESLQSVARAFYGDDSKEKLLADYNFRTSKMLAKGEKLLVPIAHVKIRAVRLVEPAPEKVPSKKPLPGISDKTPALAAAP